MAEQYGNAWTRDHNDDDNIDNVEDLSKYRE